MPSPAARSRPKIFLISFNKCGTGSFHRLFKRSGIASVHHHLPGDDANKQDPAASLAVTMVKNFMLARDPLTGIDGFEAYTDLAYYSDTMLFEGGRLYPELHRHHPDAYFILATREVEAWLASRMNHGGGSLAARAAALLGEASHAAVAETWRRQFAAHNAEACAWFAERPQARFLAFDLDGDGVEAIVDFLAPDYRIKPGAWGRANVTPEAKKVRAAEQRGAV